MPARAEEVKHAKQEGIDFQVLTNPVEFLDEGGGWLRAARCVRMELGEPDASGRRRPIRRRGIGIRDSPESGDYCDGNFREPADPIDNAKPEDQQVGIHRSKWRDAEDIAQRSLRRRRYCDGKRDGDIGDGSRKKGGEIDPRVFENGEVGREDLRDVTQQEALAAREYSADGCLSHGDGCVLNFRPANCS